LAFALGFTAGACRSADRPSTSGKLKVVASFYPLYEAAGKVGGDLADVTNLTAAGAEPHELELTTDQLDEIIDADVVIYLGKGFQPAVEKAAKRAKGETVDLLGGVKLRGPVEEGETVDPHVWLDPHLWASAIGRIADAFAKADPAGAKAFDAQRAEYEDDVGRLDGRYANGIKTCERHEIVTSHAAFGYLAARYNLTQIPISGISPEAEPNPKRIAEITDLVRRDKLTTIFTETLVSPKVAEALAREAGVKTDTLDPIEGLTDDEIAKGETYITKMDENLDALRDALGCT
jgi:zinc transport system substrate-binding protein